MFDPRCFRRWPLLFTGRVSGIFTGVIAAIPLDAKLVAAALPRPLCLAPTTDQQGKGIVMFGCQKEVSIRIGFLPSWPFHYRETAIGFLVNGAKAGEGPSVYLARMDTDSRRATMAGCYARIRKHWSRIGGGDLRPRVETRQAEQCYSFRATPVGSAAAHDQFPLFDLPRNIISVGDDGECFSTQVRWNLESVLLQPVQATLEVDGNGMGLPAKTYQWTGAAGEHRWAYQVTVPWTLKGPRPIPGINRGRSGV